MDIEPALKDQFQPFNIAPIPDNAPPEIPRATAVSFKQHSVLSISAHSLQLTTMFDEQYWDVPEKCFSYTKDRIELLHRVALDFLRNSFYYSGLIMQIDFEDKGNPTEYIEKNFLTSKMDKHLFDVSIRLTATKDDIYYINTEIYNKREYIGVPQLGMPIIPLSSFSESSHLIGVTVDVNDRYGFNFNKNYSSNYEKILKIISISELMITKKIQNFINGEVLSYE